MDQLLVLLTGATIAVMVAINGSLTGAVGVFPAAAIIHAVGSAFALALCLLQRNKTPMPGRLPPWLLLGGVIGVATTLFNNYAYGRISMTSIVALGLLGQSVSALVIDGLGLLGMEKRPVRWSALPGIAVSVLGMFLMLDRSVSGAAAAVLFSLGAGVSIVLSRTVNARLAARIGALRGSLVNHLAGLPITLALALIFGAGGAGGAGGPSRPWYYLGGALGVCVVMLFNITVPRVAAFRLTVLGFLGQLCVGAALDALAGRSFSDPSYRGGAVVAAGVLVSLCMERAGERRARAGR